MTNNITDLDLIIIKHEKNAKQYIKIKHDLKEVTK